MSEGAWTKADIINFLAKSRGYRRYLEICTPSTGCLYGNVSRSQLACSRLMYQCPDTFEDGLPIDFRSPDLDVSDSIRRMHQQDLRFDIVFVDPWHTYEASWRDLNEAFRLIGPGGAVVVHDCLPTSEDLAGPEFKEGSWCGVTYKAYIDFAVGQRDAEYVTVETDYGCGVICKIERPKWPWSLLPSRNRAGSAERRALLREWSRIGRDFSAAYRLFEQNKQELLKLKSLPEFVALERRWSGGV